MKIIYNKVSLEHETGNHPENRARLEVFQEVEETAIKDGYEYLKLVHNPGYIDRVKLSSERNDYLDPDTITSPGSFRAAVHAVGAAIAAAESGDFALVRPPGHHAYPDKATGFCLFNNIAIATQYLVNQGKRVLVFDFDGHLGDGTFHFFENTDQVLFWSIHQFPAFPGEGTPDQIGVGKGEGYSINVPLPPGSGDDIFIDAVEKFIPVARQFEPDVVAVSAGFDAHQLDPLLNLNLSLNSYYEIGKILKSEFDTVFASLEGGYNKKYLKEGVFNFLAGMNGTTQQYAENRTDSPAFIQKEYHSRTSILMKSLSKFWRL